MALFSAGCTEESEPSLDEGRASLVQVYDGELEGRDHEVSRHGFNDAVKAARLAAIDLDAMSGLLAPGARIEFALPDEAEAVLVVDAVQELLPGITTFTGHLADDEFADFTFSIEDGKLVGSIRRETQAWLVEPHAGSNLHMIRSLDRTLVPKGEPRLDHPKDEPDDAPEAPQPPLSRSLVGGNVRVLFLYASNVSNASAQAANIVTAFNNSLSLSAVSSNNYISIAGVQPVSSTFAGMDRWTIIQAMGNRSAPFTTIDTSMANTYADVAFLLVQEDPTAHHDMGPVYGRVGGVAFLQNQAKPFALSTDDYALGDLTALHELGHVFGGNHEDVASAGIARPVVAANDTWMTVMGGYVECPFNGLPATCVRLNRWSNPDQTYQGVPLGVPGQRDMESWLESSMPTVSAWRPEPPVTVYTNSFESAGDLSGWLIWHNCASGPWSSASNVFRYYTASDNPAPGGGAYALRMQTTGFTPGCQYPGAYALSPFVAATAGTTYRIDNTSRNGTQSGVVTLIFYNSAKAAIGMASRNWSTDAWVYNADTQLVATAPAGTTSLQVRYGLSTANGVVDLDLLKVTR
uniref:Uncharacterized protein n=1 Tax=Nannocystis pusilla TaxID=889268 RepID=A0A3Q8I100_9BACT|nr:hypothetical protein [Nannocystis pusilla]